MTKSEFMSYLDNRLSVLNISEREDIKQEYAQHIDIKVKNGMSESEAVANLGDISAIVDEILMAYNIDPDYKKDSGEKAEKSEKLKRIGEKFKGLSGKLIQHISSKDPLSIIKEMIIAVFVFIIVFGAFVFGYIIFDGIADVAYNMLPGFLGMDTIVSEMIRIMYVLIFAFAVCTLIMTVLGHKREVKRVREKKRMVYEKSGTGNFSLKMWETAVLIFKIFILFSLIPAIFVLIGSVVAQGVLLAAMITGYPVIGLSIGCLGFNLCMISFFAIIFKLMFGKKEVNEIEE